VNEKEAQEILLGMPFEAQRERWQRKMHDIVGDAIRENRITKTDLTKWMDQDGITFTQITFTFVATQ